MEIQNVNQPKASTSQEVELSRLNQEPYKKMLNNYESLGVAILLAKLSYPPDFSIAAVPVQLRKRESEYYLLNWKEIEAALIDRENPNNYVLIKDSHSLDQYFANGLGIISKLDTKPDRGLVKEVEGIQFIARLDSDGSSYVWGLDLRQISKMREAGVNAVGNNWPVALLGYHLPLATNEVAIAYGIDPSEVGLKHSLLQRPDDILPKQDQRLQKNDLIYALLISQIIHDSHQRNFIQIDDHEPNARFGVEIRHSGLIKQIDVFLRESNNKYVYAISKEDYDYLLTELKLPDSQSIKSRTNEIIPNAPAFKNLFPDCHNALLEHLAWKISYQILHSPLASDLFSHIESEISLKVSTDHWQLFYHRLSDAEADKFNRMDNHPDYPSHVSLGLKVVRYQDAHRIGELGRSLYYQDNQDPSLILAFSEDSQTLKKKLRQLLPIPLHSYDDIRSSQQTFLSSENAIEFSEVELTVGSIRNLISDSNKMIKEIRAENVGSLAELLIKRIREHVKEADGELDHMGLSDNEMLLPNKEKVPFYIRTKNISDKQIPAKVVKIRDFTRICEAFGIKRGNDYHIIDYMDQQAMQTLAKVDSSPSAVLKYLINDIGLAADENDIADLEGFALGIEHGGSFSTRPQQTQSKIQRIIQIDTDLHADGSPTGFSFRIRGTALNCDHIQIFCGNYNRFVMVRAGHFDCTLPSPAKDTDCILLPASFPEKVGEQQIIRIKGYPPSSTSEALKELLEVHCDIPENSDIWSDLTTQYEIEKFFLKHFYDNFEAGEDLVNACRNNASPAVHLALDSLLETFRTVRDLTISTDLDFVQKYCVHRAFEAFQAGKKGYLLSTCRKDDKLKIITGLSELIGKTLLVTSETDTADWQQRLAISDLHGLASKSGLKKFRINSDSETDSRVTCIGSRHATDNIDHIRDYDLLIWNQENHSEAKLFSVLSQLIKQNRFIIFTSASAPELLAEIGKFLTLTGVIPEDLQNLDHHEVRPLTRFSEIAKDNGLFISPSDIYKVRTQDNCPENSIPNVVASYPHEFKLTEEQLGLVIELFSETKKFFHSFGISGNPSNKSLMKRIYREIINGSERFFYPEDIPKLNMCHSLVTERHKAGEPILIYTASEYTCQELADYLTQKGLKVAHYYSGEIQYNIISDDHPLKIDKSAADVIKKLDRKKVDIAILTLKGNSKEIMPTLSCYRLLYDLPDNAYDYESIMLNAANPDCAAANIYFETLVPELPTYDDFDRQLCKTFFRLFNSQTFEASLNGHFQSRLVKTKLVQDGFFPPEYILNDAQFLHGIPAFNPELF